VWLCVDCDCDCNIDDNDDIDDNVSVKLCLILTNDFILLNIASSVDIMNDDVVVDDDVNDV
jgi:hypothetical protein